MNSKKNIVFFISSFGHGKGGHFHSLSTISRELEKENNVVVISVGPTYSETIQSAPCNHKYHFKFSGVNFFSVFRRIDEQIKEIFPEDYIVHAFDEYSYLFSRMVASKNNKVSVLTKCGGPNPKRYYPFCDNILLFSCENMSWFRSKRVYGDSSISVVANRVQGVSSDEHRIGELKNRLGINDCDLVILRVGRINESYRSTIEQSIKLHDCLCSKGVPSKLIVVGVVQNADVEKELRKSADDGVYFVTDSEYTSNAKSLIDIADVVVGTGRGLMEACSLKKIILCPNLDQELPVLLTEENSRELADLNFSPRCKVSPETGSLDQLVEMLECSEKRGLYSQFIYTFFRENFDVQTVPRKYVEFYSVANRASRGRWIDVIKNYLWFQYRVARTLIGGAR